MDFEKIIIQFQSFEPIDVIATSQEEGTTVSPVEPTIKNDPYENDKW